MEVASQKLAVDAERLRECLTQTRERLAPLEDPFDTDFGLHRWLEEDREEAYSDWLQWVVRQARSPADVFRLFNLGALPEDVAGCKAFEVRRECCIPSGHEDRAGRLDLVIHFEDKAIVVVEVKKGDADEADTRKQSGYNQWLKEQNYPDKRKYSVLLAVEADHDTYEDFRFVSCASLSVEMRRLAVELCREKRVTTAAMVLAFVAAVEQNLLGFSAGLVQAVCQGQTVLFNAAVVDHLEAFIKATGS